MADPARADEVMVTQSAATTMGLHLGEVVPVAISSISGSGPVRRIGLKVVGIGLLNREVVQDQIAEIPHLHGGDAGADPVGGRRQQHLVPGRAAAPRTRPMSRRSSGGGTRASATSPTSRFPRSSRPLPTSRYGPRPSRSGCSASLPLWPRCSSGSKSSARRLSAREHDLAVMRAVGADPADDHARRSRRHPRLGPGGSRFSPWGRVRPVQPLPHRPCPARLPGPGVNADWTVLGLGFAVLVVVLGAGTVMLAFSARRIACSDASRSFARRSSTVGLTARSGLPPSAVAGASFAVDAGSGGRPAPSVGPFSPP